VKITLNRNKKALKMSSNNYQNYITREPEAIKVLSDDAIYFSLLEDPNIEPLYTILRKGPMILEDIVNSYNAHVELKGKEQNLSVAEIKSAQKSETSIYRYIKKLEKEGIIIEAGRRIDSSSRATKALFSLSAKTFIPSSVPAEKWETPYAKRFTEVLARMYGLALEKENPDFKCLEKFVRELEEDILQNTVEYLTSHGDEITEITKDMTFKATDKFQRWYFYLYLLRNAEKHLEKLMKCYKD